MMPHAHAESQSVRSFAWLEHVGPNSELLHAIAGASLRLPIQPLGQSTALAHCIRLTGQNCYFPHFPGAMKYEFHYFPTLQVTRGCQVLLQVEVEVNRVPFESSNQIVPGGLESSVPNNWPTCAGTQSCESESRWTWNENPWYFGFGFSRLWGLDHANYVNPDFFNTVAWVLVRRVLWACIYKLRLLVLT